MIVNVFPYSAQYIRRKIELREMLFLVYSATLGKFFLDCFIIYDSAFHSNSSSICCCIHVGRNESFGTFPVM